MIGEKNKLIAEFMGLHQHYQSKLWCKKSELTIIQEPGYPAEDYAETWFPLTYHQSWDALMPVVEKIESIENVIVDISLQGTTISVYNDADRDADRDWYATCFDKEIKINHVYKAVSHFIEWYNTNHPLTQ